MPRNKEAVKFVQLGIASGPLIIFLYNASSVTP